MRKFVLSPILLSALVLLSNSPARAHNFSHCYMVLKRLGVTNVDAGLAAAELKLKKNQDDVNALWVKSEAMQFNGNLREALNALGKLLGVLTQQHASQREIAKVKAEEGLMLAYTSHQTPASKAIKNSLELEPHSNVAPLLKALSAWQDSAGDATVYYDKYIASVPDVDGYISKAHYLFVIGKKDAALRLLADAEKKYPQSPFVNYERAYIYLTSSDAQNADKFADLAEKKLVFGGSIYADIANRYKKDGKLDKQLDALRKLVQYSPHQESFDCLAQALQGRGKFDEAVRVLDKAQQLYPKVELFPDRKSKMLRLAGRWKEALAAAQDKLNRFPNDPHAYRNRGLCYEALGDYKKAVADLDKGLGNSTKYREILNRAKCNLALKNYQKALDDANLWLSTHPDNISGKEITARAFLGLGKLEDALSDSETLIKLSGDNPHFVNLKGEILAKMGRAQQSATEFARAKTLHAKFETEQERD